MGGVHFHSLSPSAEPVLVGSTNILQAPYLNQNKNMTIFPTNLSLVHISRDSRRRKYQRYIYCCHSSTNPTHCVAMAL